MVNDNFYVVTATLNEIVDQGIAVLLSFHGPYPNGYEMEGAIEDKQMDDADLIQRVRISENEILKLEVPFRPGVDEQPDHYEGHPTANGYYWVIMPDVSLSVPIHVFVQGEHCYIHGQDVARKVSDIIKYSPDSIPTFR